MDAYTLLKTVATLQEKAQAYARLLDIYITNTKCKLKADASVYA